LTCCQNSTQASRAPGQSTFWIGIILLLAAQRGGIETVLIPEQNRKDLAEIPDQIKKKLDIRPVRWIDQVLEAALTRMPMPNETTPSGDVGLIEKKKRSGKGKNLAH
jgi:ATP-dependent Lon protease